MTKKLSIGFSPCPNDTFIFYALTHGRVGAENIKFMPERLEDVETLNAMALQGELDVTKLSFHALGHVLDKYVMLGAGAALGRGCGPLLVTSAGRDISEDPRHWRIAIPGAYTTAAMLLKLYAPDCRDLQIMRFDKIMDAIGRGEVDAGVIIHESRFTYQAHGLTCVRDLGAWWEETTGLPIPLGCIAARRSLAPEIIRNIDNAVRGSVQWAYAHPDECRGYIRKHAQELDDKVTSEHIKLYVNDFSVQMGKEGRAAVEELLRRGRAAGIFPENQDFSLSLP